MRILLASIFFLFIFGCAATPKGPTISARQALPGVWGSTSESCKKNPVTYKFSEDGAEYYVKAPEGLRTSPDGELRKTITYQVIGETEQLLRAVIEGEDRRTVGGTVVIWDFVLLTNDSFCWHRLDWPKGACTDPIWRCDAT
jgi:hypothetical protein